MQQTPAAVSYVQSNSPIDRQQDFLVSPTMMACGIGAEPVLLLVFPKQRFWGVLRGRPQFRSTLRAAGVLATREVKVNSSCGGCVG